MIPLPTLAVATTAAGTVTSVYVATVTSRDDYTVQFLLVLGLVAAISFSPRIPLELGLLGERRFDIRLEDLVLIVVGLALIVLRSGTNRRIELPRYFRLLLAYFLIAGVVTAFGILSTDLSLFRGLFYLLKEVEYALIALAVTNVVRTRKQLYVFTIFFVGCALANAGWAWVQIITGSTGPLFQTVQTSGFYGSSIGVVGTTLLGEPSRLSSGGYYIAPLCLTFGWLAAARRSSRIWWAAITTMIVVAIVASLSRASTLSVAIALFVFGLVVDEIPDSLVVALPAVGAGVGLALAPVLNVARFRPAKLSQGLLTRFERWQPIFDNFSLGYLHGFGKGNQLLVVGTEEVHNQYLRLLVETGVLGVVAFLSVLCVVVVAGVQLSSRTDDPVLRSVGIAAVCATISLGMIALVQDAFANVKLAESFWLLVGALGAAIRLDRSDSDSTRS